MPHINLEDLEFEKVLGVGGFGEASLCTGKHGKQYVVKTINRERSIQKLVKREVLAGQLLKHENIAKFYTCFGDAENDYLVFEFVRGKSFFKYFQEHKDMVFSEQEARILFKQIAKAISLAHKKGIVHLDIKLDNIMFDPATFTAKVIDFGLCNFVNKENKGMFTHRVGSEDWWSPEMIPERLAPYNGFKVDVWGLGLVLYCLLNGSFPFDKRRSKFVRSSGVHPTFGFTQEISESAQDLIKRMLEVNPEKRISLAEVMSHPWMKKSIFPKFW